MAPEKLLVVADQSTPIVPVEVLETTSWTWMLPEVQRLNSMVLQEYWGVTSNDPLRFGSMEDGRHGVISPEKLLVAVIDDFTSRFSCPDGSVG
jgi:hypothetical protein